tara:strand:+ start:508 stop:1389 length:882 start_codon:yes stop_codon:yes gene_type:complete
MSKILITGGLGFVGSHLTDRLCDLGHNVTVMDNLCSESSSREYMRDDANYWIDDVKNLDKTKYASQDFDVIYHLAAHARIQPSFIDPLKYLENDIMGTAHICEYARSIGAKVVYAGSSSAYGGPMLNPYAYAKYTGEQVCEMYHKVYEMSTVTARFFNVYGDRQPTSGPYATVVGIFGEKRKHWQPLTITGDGEQRRDFTHVNDIVNGFITLGDKRWSAEIFNLGYGKNHSINELAKMFGGEKEYVSPRPGEAWETLADTSAIFDATGWKAKTSLEEHITNWKLRYNITETPA